MGGGAATNFSSLLSCSQSRISSRFANRQKPGEIVVSRLMHKAGGRILRRRFNKLSCAGWVPHFRCSVSGLPQSGDERRSI
jgi:hypothetical protein